MSRSAIVCSQRKHVHARTLVNYTFCTTTSIRKSTKFTLFAYVWVRVRLLVAIVYKQDAELIIYAQPNERRIKATGLKQHLHRSKGMPQCVYVCMCEFKCMWHSF